MFLSSLDFVSKLQLQPKIDLGTTVVSQLNSSNLNKLDLVLDTASNLEVLIKINSNLQYVFNCNQNSKLKLVFVTDNFTHENLDLNIVVNLQETGAGCEFYFLNHQNQGLASLNLVVNHLQKETKSQVLIKSVNSGSSKLQVNGTIFIPQKMINSQAGMSLKGLLLDKNSQITFKPNLKILENQVTCSHGATISSFEDQYLQYFYSRGINQEKAKTILVESFESEIYKQIPLICL